MKRLKFSIIVPAHNEEEAIGRCIESIQKQKFRDFELIISNDGSIDNTENIVRNLMKEDNRISIVSSKEGHSAAHARNRGAKIAKGEILIFIDADTFINKNFLLEINRYLGKGDAFITLNYPFKKYFVSRVLSSFLGPNLKEKLEDGTVYDTHNREIAGSMFFCVSRDYYSKIGGYSEKIFYYEDQDFVDKFYNLGGKAVFVRRANQYYELPSTISEFFRQCKWLGKGVNSIPNLELRWRRRFFWFAKALFTLLPIAFVWNLNYFLLSLIGTFLIMYSGLVKRNRDPLISLSAIPFLYMKNILVSINILRFIKKKQEK